MHNRIIAGWIGVGVTLSVSATAVMGSCALLPFIGWIVGLALLPFFLTGAMMWVSVLVILLMLSVPNALVGMVKEN